VRRLACFLLVLVLAGCTLPFVPGPIPVPPTPPVPPGPPAPPPEPQPQPTGLTRASFADVVVGASPSVLDALPAPYRKVNDYGRTVYVWRLDEARPEGGTVNWQVHVADGKVVASFAW
jgi:hypothetical protein